MIVRAALAVFVGLPLVFIANLIGYWFTLFSLTIFLGCIAPQWAIEGLAAVEFFGAMIYSLIGLFLHVIDPEINEHPRR